jgi:hypothetical protein
MCDECVAANKRLAQLDWLAKNVADEKAAAAILNMIRNLKEQKVRLHPLPGEVPD